ncbi:hypothetical protein NC651_026139 [Populus alba x Populus x berolinensis]|nr:hypothetical protein NC651_026139 [Populus alba x Populus x berolinensis]
MFLAGDVFNGPIRNDIIRCVVMAACKTTTGSLKPPCLKSSKKLMAYDKCRTLFLIISLIKPVGFVYYEKLSDDLLVFILPCVMNRDKYCVPNWINFHVLKKICYLHVRPSSL